MNRVIIPNESEQKKAELVHFGIPGMRWGIKRMQPRMTTVRGKATPKMTTVRGKPVQKVKVRSGIILEKGKPNPLPSKNRERAAKFIETMVGMKVKDLSNRSLATGAVVTAMTAYGAWKLGEFLGKKAAGG